MVLLVAQAKADTGKEKGKAQASMKLIEITTRKMVNGEATKAELPLGAVRATILRVDMNYPCRVVLYHDQRARDKDYGDSRQPSTPAPLGVQAEIIGTYCHTFFDFSPLHFNGNRWLLRKPVDWQPVEIFAVSPGTVPCMIEARAGNAKHKPNFIIRFYIED